MTRRPVTVTLDVLTVALAVLAAAIINLGGFIVRVADVRIRFRTLSRTLLWLALVVLLRLIVDRRSGPFGVSVRSWRSFLLLPVDAFRRLPIYSFLHHVVEPICVFLRLLVAADPFQVRAAPGVWRRATFASLGIGLALVILVHEQIRHLDSVPDFGDPLFSIWRMGWVLHQLIADPAHLFDANIFYPQSLTLTFSDPIILQALTGAPLLAIGVHPVIVYNLLLLSGFWFSGIATYLLVERLTASPRAAFIAGLVYACYSYRFEHYSHLELQMTQWMPLGLLALHLFVTSGRWPYAIALALAGVAQLYSSLYYAVFFLVYAAFIGAGLLIVHRPPLRRLVLPAAAGALVAGLIAVPVVRAFVAAQPLKGERPIGEITYYSATPSDYLRANRRSVLWRNRTLPPEPERALFPGVTPLVLGAIGVAPPVSGIRLVYAAGLLVAFDGSLGLNGTLYPLLHRWLPPVRGLRVPARFSALVGLTLAIFAGFGAHRILGWCRSRTREWAVIAALVAAVVIDAWPALALAPVWKEPPPIYETLKARPGVVLAEFPVDANEVFSIPYMYFSLWHWTSMVNGYSGFIPAPYQTVAPHLLEFPRGNTVALLRWWGVTHVTVNCGLRYAGCEDIMNLLRSSTDVRLIEETSWEGQPVRLFELAGS